MKENLAESQVVSDIAMSERELVEPDGRAVRLWERIKVPASLWAQSQYPVDSKFWVIAVLGKQCLYFNYLEGGWGWGEYEEWGEIKSFHWQDTEIHHIVFQTLFAIDEGGTG